MIPYQNPPDADLTSADELGQHVASSFSQAPCLFEQDCLYYPDIARGLPMFRIVESTDSSPADQYSVSIRDSFGEGVYIEANRLDRLCSTTCHCHRLGPQDFAFIVSKQPAHTNIEVRSEVLQNTLIDVIRLDERHSHCDPPAWDGAQLFAQYEKIEVRLQAVIDAPVGSLDAKPFLPLRLLVDGFLGQELERSLPSPRHKDPSYVLRDVFPEGNRNSLLGGKLLKAAREGDIAGVRLLLDLPTFESTMTDTQFTEDSARRRMNINAHDRCGNTALIRATLAGHTEIAKLLLRHGADIDWANNQGETALHKAAEARHIKLVSLLIEEGADIHAKDNSGATPAHSWSSWAHSSFCDLKELTLALTRRRERSTISIKPSEIKPSEISALFFAWLFIPSDSTMDYENLLFDRNPQLRFKNTDEAKAVMRRFFIQQYSKVRQHNIFERVRGRFPTSTRAWQFGMEALKNISYGYLPHELGMTMALLCVCKTVSLTLHVYGYDLPSRRLGDYPEAFEASLSRWLALFHGDDRVLFADTIRDIWNVQLHPLRLFCSMDYHDMFKYVERLISDLINAVERLSSSPTISAEQRNPRQVQQGPSGQERPPPNDPDPGDPYIGTKSTPHDRAAISRGARSRKSLLWVELMASPIFSILLIFLLWLLSLHLSTETVQSVAIGTAEWPIDTDAQSVARSTQPCFTDSLEAQQTLGVPSPAPEQDMIMSGQGYDDRHHTQPLESPSLSPLSGGIPGSVHESSGSPRPFACLETNCKKRFTRKDNRDRHFKNHHELDSERKRPCKTCGKDYNAQYLSVHKCNPNKPFKRRSRAGH